MSNIEFVSYDGAYPNLCSGTLVLRIDDEEVRWQNCLCSGGSVWFDGDWDEHVDSGPWTVRLPCGYEHLTEEITRLVNDKVREGCCGGCV